IACVILRKAPGQSASGLPNSAFSSTQTGAARIRGRARKRVSLPGTWHIFRIGSRCFTVEESCYNRFYLSRAAYRLEDYMALEHHQTMSIEEYLALEAQHLETRYEYVITMAGGTVNLDTIKSKLERMLRALPPIRRYCPYSFDMHASV